MSNRNTGLNNAIKRGNINAVSSFIKNTPRNRLDMDSITYKAIRAGQVSIVDMALKRGVSPNTMYHNGYSDEPLFMHAIRAGHLDIVKLMLRHKVNLNLRGQWNLTPLLLAVISKKTELVRELVKYKQDMNATDVLGQNAVIHAISDATPDILKLLVKNKASVNFKDARGTTPLHVAVRQFSPSVDPYIMVKILIDAGAKVNAKTEANVTPLHDAVVEPRNALAVTRLLLRSGADPNIRDSEGSSPLMDAVESGERDRAVIVKELLKYDASLSIKNIWGDTALHIAAREGDTESIKVLLDAGANPLLKNRKGLTAADILNRRAENTNYNYNSNSNSNSNKQTANMLRKWPAERTLRRRAANKALNKLPNNLKKKILSKTGLFAINEYGRKKVTPKGSNR